MKTYTFYDDSWYDQPPCDCCEGSWMWCYNSGDTDSRLGSAHSEEDCYIHAIFSEVGWDNCPEVFEQELWELDFEELKHKADKLGIIVEIVS